MQKLIAANWKMYLTLRQSVTLAKEITKSKIQNPKLEIVLCPSFVALEEVGKIVHGTRIKLGAQDVEPERRGAFTGEVGLDDLRELGVKYVLVGHSERRRMGETDARVNQKLRAVLAVGMKPILCVGEPWGTRRQGMVKVRRYVGDQIRRGLRGVLNKDLKQVVIAYEPVWAISGSGGHADKPEDASRIHAYIRKAIGAKNMSVLYGGSVNSKNVLGFISVQNVQGLLVGKASTKLSEFSKIIQHITVDT